MGEVGHLLKVVWAELGTIARWGYLAVGVLSAIIASPLFEHAQTILRIGHPIGGISPWTAVAVVVIGIMSATIQALTKMTFRQEKELLPTISVIFDPKRGGVFVDQDKSASRQWDVKYIRVRVDAISQKPDVVCRAYMTSIEKDSGNGFKPTAVTDSLQLTWSGGDPGRDWGDIYYGVHQFVNLTKISARSKKMEFCSHVPLSIRALFADIAIYRMTIQVVSNGVSHPIVLDIKWGGDIDNVVVNEVVDGAR